MTKIAPYGSWESPITAADVARGQVALGFPSAVAEEVWWQEGRPDEGGRTTVMASAGAGTKPRELVPAPYNARTRVHEYGGRSYLPVPRAGGGFGLVFANFADQRLYHLASPGEEGREPRPLTPEPAFRAGLRYADMVLSPDGREAWCVREAHADADGKAITRAIVAIPLDGSAATDPDAVRVLVSGADFFAFPAPSPDGTRLAWISWDHPRMPWDGTELRVGPVSGSTVSDSALVIGGLEESVLAPAWSGDDSLYVVSDASGWWNLYEVAARPGASTRPLCPREEEFAGPLWQLGGRPYIVLGDGRLAVLHGAGETQLSLLDPVTGDLTEAGLSEGGVPFRTFGSAGLSGSGMTIVASAGGPSTPHSVIRASATTLPEAEVIRREVITIDPAYLPVPREVALPTGVGDSPVVHALVYPPSSPFAIGPADDRPPYIVWVHGGPTSNVLPALDLEKAYFTSRGIGIVDVNYGGSTGYGRAYRNRLRGQWGIVDVEDAMNSALALARAGEADRSRLGIRGSSAGGWTVLASVTSALASDFEPVFAAGVSYFGVSDLAGFSAITHDFESRYLDGLIGPLPEAAALYEERSPIGHVGPGTCPILLLQGLDDPIVPPPQAESIARDLATHAIPYAYIAFEGESHGFRKASSIIVSLEAELAFYGQILGFDPPGVPPVKLEGAGELPGELSGS
ncbi:MAG TPA: prolyl oligopeptidase family serine peptidase [Trebonia sp.]|nr:prolyl oligopeptidase family serine peptidase [Trebonia sp.]